MRLYRRYRRLGLRCVPLKVGRAEIDGLVAKGYLAAGDREDLEAIASAIDNLMSEWLSSA
jgi:hypothetical protein